MLAEFRQTLSDPHSMHAAMVHLPIALSLAGFLLLVGLAATRFRSRDLKYAAVACYALAVISAFAARQKGEAAADNVERVQPPLTQAEHAALERHEDLAEIAHVWILIPGVLGGLTLLKPRPAQIGAGVAAVIAAGAIAGYVGYLGHTGGSIVYQHGLGVPDRGAGRQAPLGDAAAPDAPPPDTTGEPQPDHDD